MAGDEQAMLNDIMHEINPPNRMNIHYERSPSMHPPDKEEEEIERSAKIESLVKWSVYGCQVAVSTAMFHPFSYARVLMELGYEPAPPRPSRTVFGKPCLVLPNIGSYVQAIQARDGRLGLWSGFGANFCSVLFGNLCNDLAYHMVDEFVKRKIRPSPRKAWSVFVVANQENVAYSVADFVEDLSKEVFARIIGQSLSYPFQVLFVRTAAQFVLQERIYTGFYGSFVQIYHEEGFRGFYGGFVPYMMAEIGGLIAVWIAAYLFRVIVTGDRLWLTIFRFATDYVVRSFLWPFKLVSRLMAVSDSPLKLTSFPKFLSWPECYRHLRAQGDQLRGNNIMMRVITNTGPGSWEKYGYYPDPVSGYPVSKAALRPPVAIRLPSETIRPAIIRMEIRFLNLTSDRSETGIKENYTVSGPVFENLKFYLFY